MSSNFLLNLDIINKNYQNKTDISKYPIKKTLKIKKDTNKINKLPVNLNEESKKLKNEIVSKILKDYDKSSKILLDIINKKTENNIFKKYNIKKDIQEITDNKNNKTIQKLLMKKKFLNYIILTHIPIFSLIK